MLKISTVDRPYLLTFHATGTTYPLSAAEAQRLLDEYPAFSPPNTWYVLVDGDLDRQVAVDESYAVASAVEHAINHPEAWEPTEAYEIADHVRRRWPR